MAVFSPLGRTAAPPVLAPSLPRVTRSPGALQAATDRVLVLLDATGDATAAAWRGALVARDRGLPLHLLALVPANAPLQPATAAVDALATELRRHLGLQVSAQAVAGRLLREGLQAAAEAALLVLPAGAPGLLARWAQAARALGLLRRTGRPLLLVRRPAAGSYRCVVAAVALEAGAATLIAAARLLSRDPRMKVLHVLPTDHEETLRLADVPEPVIQRERERAAQHARTLLAGRIAAAGADRDGAVPVIAFGHVANRILERDLAACADLLVVGKHLRPAWSEALRGSVARRVLAAGRADVLVLPLRERQP